MQYLLLIYEAENARADHTEAQQKEMLERYFAFNDYLKSKDAFIAGDALQSVATATSVRKREGKVVTTDGPFAETKEQLGGYYLVEAKDLDEAIEFASRIPAADLGTVEVRPLMVFE